MDKFFEYFEIPKVEYEEPGRDVDDEGNIASWYVTELYPDVEPHVIDLLDYYNTWLNGNPLCIDNITPYKLCKVVCDAVLNKIKAISLVEDVEDYKQDIRAIFMEEE